MRKFSITEAISFGWETMKANLGFFVGILILAWVIQFATSYFMEQWGKKYPMMGMLIYLLSIFVNILVGMGLIKISLKFSIGEQGRLEDLFSCAYIFLPYLGASILSGLAVLGGCILLIIPGIIIGIRLQFYVYLMIDRNASAIESLKESFALTRGATWDLFVFGIMLGLINLAGALCLLIGLFATVPTSMVALAYVYRKLLQSSESYIAEGASAQMPV